MKIARLRNKGELELKNEIIEYPPELEGNRNLFTGLYTGHANHPNYNINNWTGAVVKIKPNTTYTVKRWSTSNRFQIMTGRLDNGIYARMTHVTNTVGTTANAFDTDMELTITSGENDEYLVVYLSNQGHFNDILLKVEEDVKATPYTPSPEDLGLDYPDFIKKFNQKIYPHGVILTPEIIEFPIELAGKRNLFSGEFYRDINNYDGVLVYRYHLTNLKSNKRYAVRSWLKKGEVAESGFWITLTSGHPNPNNASANGGTYTHIISGGNPMNSQVLPRNNVPVYVSYYPPSADPSVLDKYNISIQQLDSGYISEWNPAPYDLGVSYSEDIDSFGIRPFGDVSMVSEVREIPSELFGANRNLIKNSNSTFKNQSGYLGATLVATENIEVEEWGTNEATRIQTSGGTSMLKLTPSISYKFSVRATYSVYIKNNSQHSMRMRFNGFNSTYIHLVAGEQKRVVVTGNFRDNYAWFQRQLWTDDISHELDVSLWREKLELGDNVTRWTPAPEDLGFNYPDEIQSF